MSEVLRETPVKSETLLALAEALKSARKAGNFVLNWPSESSPTGRAGLGDLLGQGPEEIERWSYGSSPLTQHYRGISSLLPTLQEKRKGPVADAIGAIPFGGPSTAAKGGALAAVKAPGGLFIPESQMRMAKLLFGDVAEQPQHISDWVDKAIPKYFSRHLGTERDPIKGLEVQTGTGPRSYESLTDRSLRKYGFDQLDPEARPLHMRQGEEAWDFNPGFGLQDYYQHVGDVAGGLPPEDLARMDFPSLVQAVKRIDERNARQLPVARQADDFQSAAERITHEAEPYKVAEGEAGSMYKFDRNVPRDQLIKQLSVDTEMAGHCVGGICPPTRTPGAVPREWFNRWVPMIDIRTGEPITGPSIHRAESGYLDPILKGRNEIFSYRNKQGTPGATLEVAEPRVQSGIARSDAKAVVTPANYLRWQREMAKAGVNPENVVWELPGGGRGSPARGRLDERQIESIIEMFPQYADQLRALQNARPAMPLSQLQGYKNRIISPQVMNDLAEVLPKLNLTPRYVNTITSRGLYPPGATKNGDPITSLRSLPYVVKSYLGRTIQNDELAGELGALLSNPIPRSKRTLNDIVSAKDFQIRNPDEAAKLELLANYLFRENVQNK